MIGSKVPKDFGSTVTGDCSTQINTDTYSNMKYVAIAAAAYSDDEAHAVATPATGDYRSQIFFKVRVTLSMTSVTGPRGVHATSCGHG